MRKEYCVHIKGALDLVKLKNIVSAWEYKLDENKSSDVWWNNDDKQIVISTFGHDKEYKLEIPKMLATCFYLMKGTPFISKQELKVTNEEFNNINGYEGVDTSSIIDYYKKLIELRESMDLIKYGKYDLIMKKSKQIFAYTRTLNYEKLLVVCNFTNKTSMFNLPPNLKYSSCKIIIYNYVNEGNPNIKAFKLRPYEAKVFLLK